MDNMCGIEHHFLCDWWDFLIKKEKHRWLGIRRFSCFCGFNASDAVSDGLKLGQRRGLVCFIGCRPKHLSDFNRICGYHAFSQCCSDCFRSKKHKVQVIMKPRLHNQQTSCNQHLQRIGSFKASFLSDNRAYPKNDAAFIEGERL